MKTKYQHPANPERARAMAELRRSNAAGSHLDKRTKRARTRAAAIAKARLDYRRS